MKSGLSLITLFLAYSGLFSQNQLITFNLDNKTVFLNNQLSNADLVQVAVGNGNSVIFDIKSTGNLQYSFEIKRGPNSLIILTQDDFRNPLKTDNQLKLKGVSLSGAFTVMIFETGHLLIKRGFNISVTQRGNSQPVHTDSPATTTSGVQPSAQTVNTNTAHHSDTAKKYKPGIAYYDALILKNNNSISDELLYSVLCNYQESGFTTATALVTMINANPFLKGLINTDTVNNKIVRIRPLQLDSLIRTQGAGFFQSGAFSALGGLDVTNIANGLAQLMIKRGKEELTIAFFNKFKQFADSNQEFKILFPKTTDNLSNLLSYRYPEMIPALRKSFFDDLSTITYHLDDVMELPRYQELLKNFPEIKVAIRSLRLIHEIESGDSHPADVIMKFADFKEWGDLSYSNTFKNVGNTVKLSAIFSNSLRNNPDISGDATRAWITYKQLDTLVTDPTLFKIYLGLIYQLAKKNNIKFYHKDNSTEYFTDVMIAHQNNIFMFENKVTRFIELANKVDKTLDTLKEKKSQHINLTNDDYYNYVDVSLDVIDFGYSIAQVFNEKLLADEYVNVARKVNDLYRNVYRKEYTQAVTNAVDIFNNILDMLGENKENLIKEAKSRFSMQVAKGGFLSFKDTKSVPAFEKANKPKFDSLRVVFASLPYSSMQLVAKLNALSSSRNIIENIKSILERLKKYGLFMANIVGAKNADDVEAVVENAVLPVGSSSIKKNSSFNISVQSYIGASLRFGSTATAVNSAWNARFGVTAPIGIAFSWGIKKVGSVSAFINLFDLGAIVDYQLKKDTTVGSGGQDTAVIKKDYQVNLGQIISPGAYVVYGFGLFKWNIPLSIGIGGQYGPGLGKIEKNGSETVNNPSWHWNMFLAVDIPFFNIVNKPFKKSK